MSGWLPTPPKRRHRGSWPPTESGRRRARGTSGLSNALGRENQTRPPVARSPSCDRDRGSRPRRPCGIHRLGTGAAAGEIDAVVRPDGGAGRHRASLVGAARAGGGRLADRAGRLLCRRSVARHGRADGALCRGGADPRHGCHRRARAAGGAGRYHPPRRRQLHRVRRARHRPDHRRAAWPVGRGRAAAGRLHGLLRRGGGACAARGTSSAPNRRRGCWW